MWSFSLFANLFANNRGDPLSRPEILWGTMGLTVALLTGAIVIYMVDKWRKRMATSTNDEGTGALTSFRAMYEAGEITEAEYAELRRRLAEKAKKPSQPAPPAANATSASPVAQSGEHISTTPPPSPPNPTESPPPPSTA